MPAIQWQDDYALHIQDFDKHHKKLFNLINDLYDDYTSGATDECVRTVLHELIDYAKYHFSAEEHWMMDSSYPDIVEHLNQHTAFIRRVAQITDDYESGNREVVTGLVSFVSSWISAHILKTDARLKNFCIPC